MKEILHGEILEEIVAAAQSSDYSCDLSVDEIKKLILKSGEICDKFPSSQEKKRDKQIKEQIANLTKAEIESQI